MTRIFLNELKDVDRQLAEPEAGKWKPDPSFLEKFANDIHIRGQLDDRISNSVPSVFARPIQFWQALRTENHPMHETVVGQWRGLLAMFALQTALGIPLRVARYSIREEADENDLDYRFVQILRSQRPRPAEEWTSWLLIYCNDRLVGATSPWTMVYTPSAAGARPRVSWAEPDGRLTDPGLRLYDDRDGASNVELRALLTWVNLLLAAHPWGMPAHHQDQSSVLARELRKWQKELARKVKPLDGINALMYSHSQALGAFQWFLATLPVKPVDETEESDFGLADDDNCGTLVLSRTALSNPRFQKQRVHGGVCVEHLDLGSRALPGPSGAAGWTTKDGTVVNRPYIIAEEYFLSDRLLALPTSDAAWNAGNTEYALPLRPVFFEHFRTSSLARQIVTLEPSSGGVTVRLRLPLKNGGSMQVERVYRDTEIEHIPDGHHVPALAIWPDFYDAGWNDYEALLVDAGPKSGRLQYQPILGDGKPGAAVALTEDHPEIAVWRAGQPVIGFGIEVVEVGRKPATAGVVIRRSVKPVEVTNETWEVGIDFGTSNTQIKRRSPEGESPFPLKGRALLLTHATAISADVLGRIHHRNEIVPPFPTLLKKTSFLDAASGRRESMGIIPLETDFARLASDSGEFVRDVKWAADEDTQKRYLQSLVRLTAAEARAAGVALLNLRWSYPLSLPAKIFATMESFWSAVGEPPFGAGFVVTGEANASESDALSRYVTARDVLPIADDSLSIGLDVGGGSTDIAFWSGQTLIDRVSLNIAVNDIVRLAAAFPDLNSALATRSADTVLASSLAFQRAFQSRPEILWNVLLAPHDRQASPHANPFVTQMHKTTTESWRKARTGAFLAMGGAFFYLGVHAGLHVEAATDHVAIYVGGRGSSVLAWLAPAKRLRELLIQLFLQGLSVVKPDAKPEVEIVGSVVGIGQKTLLKDEVASGLLERSELTAPTRAGLDVNSSPLGEVHWVDAQGKELQWQTPVSAKQLTQLKPPANHNSSYIAYYLTKVARPEADKLNLDVAGLSALQLSQNWAINDIRKKTEDYIVQPIFAYELKSLMRRYSQAAGQIEVEPTE